MPDCILPLLPHALRLGPTHLTVSDLDGSITFYEDALGLQLRDRDGGFLVRDPWDTGVAFNASG